MSTGDTVNLRSVPQVSVWPRSGGPSFALDAYLLHLQVVTALQPPNGFTLTLTPDNPRADRLAPLLRKLRPQSLVSIGVDTPGGLMLGLISSVKQTQTYVGGQFATVIVVQGEDLAGKALTRDNILLSLLTEEAAATFFDHVTKVLGRNHPVLVALQSALGPTDDVQDVAGFFTSRDIASVVEWAVNRIPMMVLPVLKKLIGGTGHIGAYLDTSHSVTEWNDQRIWSEEPQTYNGNLLGFLQSVVGGDFYEVFTATIPVKGQRLPTPALIVRPKPFDDPEAMVAPTLEETGNDWPSLRTMITDEDHHEIPVSSMHTMQAEISDAQTFGYYAVTSANELIGNDEQAAEGMRFPLLDTFTATVYGAQSMQPRLTLVSPAFDDKVAGNVDYTGEVPAAVREFRNRLFNWYRWNPWYVNGSVTVHGKDSYRAGDKLFFPDYSHPFGSPLERGMYAYCVGAMWEWSLGGQYTTALRFERGQTSGMYTAAKAEIAADAATYGVIPAHYASS